MKKLISKWPDRLISLFVPAAIVASFFAPASVWASKEMRVGGGGTGGSEGDPLDTNDVGGGGGGGTEISIDASPTLTFDLWELISDRYQVLVVPEIVGGTVIFRIIVVDKADLGLTDYLTGEYYAP